MKKKFTASVWQEGNYCVAQCLEVDVASQGASEDEALASLQEALEIHFTSPVASIVTRMHRIDVEIDG